MSKVKDYGDALERTLWTALEGAGAVGLVTGYQALPLPDVPAGYVVLLTIVVGALLAAGKGIIATNVGNGTASTLPASNEPVPAAVARKLEHALAAAPAGSPSTEVVQLEDEPRVGTGANVVLPDAPGQNGADQLAVDPDPDLNGDGHGDVTGRFKTRS